MIITAFKNNNISDSCLIQNCIQLKKRTQMWQLGKILANIVVVKINFTYNKIHA